MCKVYILTALLVQVIFPEHGFVVNAWNVDESVLGDIEIESPDKAINVQNEFSQINGQTKDAAIQTSSDIGSDQTTVNESKMQENDNKDIAGSENTKIIESEYPNVEDISEIFTNPEFQLSNSRLEPADIDVESSIDEVIAATGLTPEEQIEKLQAASQRMTKCIESEFASLESMISSGKRSKRDLSSQTGNKYLMRFLKHIRANNEYQNMAIDKMMSAQEMAEKFGIHLDSDLETNEINLQSVDLNVAASEINGEISNANTSSKNNVTTTDDMNSQQYTTDTTSIDRQAPGAAYYYYQVEEPIETTIQTPPTDEISKQAQTVNTDQPLQYEINTADSEHNPEQLPLNFDNEGITQSRNPLYFYQYPSASLDEQSPIPEEVIPEVITEEIEEKIETDATSENGGEPKVNHINRCSTHRHTYVSSGLHYHSRANALPQQYQYYFALV